MFKVIRQIPTRTATFPHGTIGFEGNCFEGIGNKNEDYFLVSIYIQLLLVFCRSATASKFLNKNGVHCVFAINEEALLLQCFFYCRGRV